MLIYMNEERWSRLRSLIKTRIHIVCISFQMGEKKKKKKTKESRNKTMTHQTYLCIYLSCFRVSWLLLWTYKGQFNKITTTNSWMRNLDRWHTIIYKCVTWIILLLFSFSKPMLHPIGRFFFLSSSLEPFSMRWNDWKFWLFGLREIEYFSYFRWSD